MKWWDQMPWSHFWMLSFKPAFSLSTFPFIKRLFSSSWFSTMRVVLSAYWTYWYFSKQPRFQLVLHPAPHFAWCTCIKVKYAGWQYTVLMYSFHNLEPVHSSMSSSNCCFFTCIQGSQEAGKVVRYSHLFKNFPQFFMIHRVNDISVLNEVNVFIKLSYFFYDLQWTLAIWSLVPQPFINPAWTSGSSQFMYCWSLVLRILSITLLTCEMSAIVC